MAFKLLREVLEIGEEHKGILTARATEAYLAREVDGSTLTAKITDLTEVLTTSRERREHFKTADKMWLSRQLEKWNNGDNYVVIATRDHPLEVITNDVCLLLTIEGIPYLVSTLRDIAPIGWLISGGCPNNFSELKAPHEIAFREVCEEVLIGDVNGNAYTFGLLDEHVQMLFSKLGLSLGPSIKRLSLETIKPKRQSGKNADASWFHLHTQTSKFSLDTCVHNAVIDIDPEIASACTTLYCNITLPTSMCLQDLRLYDGEELPDGTMLKRPMRLTKKDGACIALFIQGQYVPVTGGWITETSAKQTAIV